MSAPSLLQIVHLAHQSRTLNRRHPRLGRAALASSEPLLPSFRPGQLAWLASLCVSSHLRYNLADLRMTRLVVERGLAVAQGLPTPQAATQLLSAAASVRLRAPRHQQVGTLGCAACVRLAGPTRQQAGTLGAAASLRLRGVHMTAGDHPAVLRRLCGRPPWPQTPAYGRTDPSSSCASPWPHCQVDTQGLLLHLCA